MSMTYYTFLDKLPDMDKWKKAIRELDLPMNFHQAFDISNHEGGLFSCSWKNEEADLELWTLSTNIEDPKDWGIESIVPLLPDRTTVLNWIWSGNLPSACFAQGANIALIDIFNAYVYSPDGDCLMNKNDLLKTIAVLEKSM